MLYCVSNVVSADLQIPTIPALAQVPVPMVVPSSCFMLTNMFNPSKEEQPGWEIDIRDDVLEACMAFGSVVHVYVDRYSQVFLLVHGTGVYCNISIP